VALEPFLSVVATSRNDNHGGDIDRRMQLCLAGLAAQANRHELPVELVLVEWNPPPDPASGFSLHRLWAGGRVAGGRGRSDAGVAEAWTAV